MGGWLRPECTVPFSGRHGRRQPGRSGEGARRGPLKIVISEARTVQAIGPGTVPLSLSHRATDAVDQHYPHRHGVVAQSMT